MQIPIPRVDKEISIDIVDSTLFLEVKIQTMDSDTLTESTGTENQLSLLSNFYPLKN